ncbi:unnamed protein product, partial [Polarella glacialis]
VWAGELSGGRLHLFRWEGDRLLRVWTPPGFEALPPDAPRRTLWLNDGQNLFRDE